MAAKRWTLRSLASLTAVAMLAHIAGADETLSGPWQGDLYFQDEDVYLNGVTLTGDLSVTVSNGTIYVTGPVNGSAATDGDDGMYGDQYYDFDLEQPVEIPPTNGENGRDGFNLVLQTHKVRGGLSTADIWIQASIGLQGRDGGAGGDGAYGFAQALDGGGCVDFEPQLPAAAGRGGNGGSLIVRSAGHIYWGASIDVSGGDGGSGGEGAGILAPVGSIRWHPDPVATPGSLGGSGGSAGSVSLSATKGTTYATAGVTITADGGRGGQGGQGGGNGAITGEGGDGGRGGGAGWISLGGSNISNSNGSGSWSVSLTARPGLGGNGGTGGAGGNGSCDSGCGCDGDEACVRGAGAPGGRAGFCGTTGTIQVRVPRRSSLTSGNLTLIGLSADTSGLTSSWSSGGSGDAGTHCELVGGLELACPNTPEPGTRGTHGANGGLIAIEGGIINLTNCVLSARGGDGSDGGNGGDGGSTTCATVNGAAGGQGGEGGNGGRVEIYGVSITGTGGNVYVCAGNGGQGGDGGCPGGLGGAGNARGSAGSYSAWVVSGTAPSNPFCSYPFPQSGSTCP